MRCPQRHYDAPTDAVFCPKCGSKLTLLCAQCQTANAPDHRFCKQCGQPLVAAAARIPSGMTPASPQSYTPRYLAEKILTSRDAMEGERKEVTVLFCDIVGSSSLAERLDPEAMHPIMDRALRLMAEAIHRYEGTVNQFLGDGLMALFGAPVALEDHALRAVMAALMMQETISAYNA
jgi:class 3 adenylate cyclase